MGEGAAIFTDGVGFFGNVSLEFRTNQLAGVLLYTSAPVVGEMAILVRCSSTTNTLVAVWY